MSVLVYSPRVRLVVATDTGYYDVSEDIVAGSCTLVENGSHQMSMTLMNRGRRYDKLFKPNDRFALYLKRLSELLVMTGYLDMVPLYSAWPRSIQITGSSTLKRLQFHYWDPGTTASVNLFNDANGANMSNPNTFTDKLMVGKAQALLTEVGGWNSQQIHFGSLPSTWVSKVSSIAQTVFPQIGLDYSTGMPIFSGATPFTSSIVTLDFLLSNAPTGGALPADFGSVTLYSGPKDIQDSGSYYCQMQWGYENPDGSTPSGVSPTTVKQFLTGQKLMVGSPDTGQAVIVQPAGWGPAPAKNATIGLSQDAINALSLPANGQVQIAWIKDPTTIGLGPYNPVKQQSAPSGSNAVLTLPGNLAKLNSLSGTAYTPTSFYPLQYGNSQSNYTTISNGDTTYNVAKTGQTQSTAAKQAVQFATSQVGAPYTWGGVGPYAAGYDCSGLVMAAWAKGGASIPHFTVTQYNTLPPLPADPSTWLPGDLVFYNDGSNNGIGGQQPGHVKMFIGAAYGQYLTVEAPYQGHPVFVGPLDTGSDFMGARRVTSDTSSSLSPQQSSTIGQTGSNLGTGSSFISVWSWFQNAQTVADPLSNQLTGYRALLNDVPLLPTIQQVVNAGMRNFCSAPNGDFIAWFPDYFNVYNTLGVIDVQDIELQDFTIMWSDQTMVTHQYAVGTYNPNLSGTNPDITSLFSAANAITTGGVATVDFPALLENLLSLNPNDPTFSTEGILSRFGARPNFQSLGLLMGPMAEFWYAVFLFQQNWASQFSASVPLVFMPELYPGMIMRIPSRKFQVYVSQVTHSWSLGGGGGFQTQATVTAPSSLGGGGFYGLVKGGSWGA